MSLFLGIGLFDNVYAAAKSKPMFNKPMLGKPMFSVFSWNILGPNTQDVDSFFPEKKGDYSRLNQTLKHIPNYADKASFMPSILSFQEVDQISRKKLGNALKAKGYVEVAYQPKGRNGGTVLYVKQSDFKVIKRGGIDLGDGGSAALGLLQSKKTNTKILASSLHLSRGDDSRTDNIQKGERQLTKLQAASQKILAGENSKKVHKIFAGDFNTNAQEMKTSSLGFLQRIDNDFKKYFDIFAGATTSNDVSGQRKGIDHIVSSDNLLKVCQFSKIIGNNPGKRIHDQVPSDHAVLYAVFQDQ
jgi:exonuclease III